MPFAYPISLELSGRLCAVIGGGIVAEHKARALLEAGARVKVIAKYITSGLEEMKSEGRVVLCQREYQTGDLAGCFLAVAATDDPKVNQEIFEEAERERVLLNSVDDIAHCHFAVPSVLKRGDLLIAISTGGKAPALAKRLRVVLSRYFRKEYAELVDLLGEVREEALAERTVDFDTWADRWQSVLDLNLLPLIKNGRRDEARQQILRVLSGDQARDPRKRGIGVGWVAIVGAGPGDPNLITVKGKGLIAEADVVVYDRLIHPSLLRGKRGIYAGKRAGTDNLEQASINALLVRLARSGKSVVRLKGGDPFVFGRGAEEAEALAWAGIPFEIVPAPTSAVAALAYAGIPVTDRRFSSSVAIVTGRSANGRKVDWEKLASGVDTLVILMGLSELEHITSRLLSAGLPASTPSAVVENGTLENQRSIAAPLGELVSAVHAAGMSSPAVIVVGEVVRLARKIAWFENQQETSELGGFVA